MARECIRAIVCLESCSCEAEEYKPQILNQGMDVACMS